MKTDDDGQPHAVTLDDAKDAILSALKGGDVATSDAPDTPWISYATDYGKDRGERVILIDITDPSGVCEGFQLSLTRDII